MTFRPLVSLLIPCYNVEDYLQDCLDSALGQDYRELEIICVDDGSTDKTNQILKYNQALDSRIVIIEKNNSGYGASMNIGLRRATGKYVAILESDDKLKSDAISAMVELAEHYNAPMVKANFYLYYSTDSERLVKKELIHGSSPQLVHPEDFIDVFFYMPSIWSALYNRSFLEDNKIAFLETPGASYQDTSFAFKVCAKASSIVLSPEAYLLYRQDNSSSSIHSKSKAFAICAEFKELECFLHENNLYDDLVTLETRYKYDCYIWNLWRLDDKQRTGFVDYIERELRKDLSLKHIDFSIYLPWNQVYLLHILKNKKSFLKWADRTSGKTTVFSDALRYLKYGGPRLLVRRLEALFHPHQ